MSSEIPDFCPDFSDRGSDLASLLESYSTSEIIECLAKNRFQMGVIMAALEKKDEKNVVAKTFVRGRDEELELLVQDVQQQVFKLREKRDGQDG